MSFFRREEGRPAPADPLPARPAPPAPRSGAAAAVTRIAAGTRVEGAVLGTTEVWIEGEVAGRVEVDGRVVVAAGGRVDGSVGARVVEVSGRVDGDVAAGQLVELTATGVVEGDVAAPRVVIAEGAFFKGKVEMGTGGGAATAAGSGPPQAGRGAQ